MELNEKGKELFYIWEAKYCKENDRLGGNSSEGNFVEGWCIIETDEYVKTLNDVAGLLIYGHMENAIGEVEEWIEKWGEDDTYFNFKLIDIVHELEKYLE